MMFQLLLRLFPEFLSADLIIRKDERKPVEVVVQIKAIVDDHLKLSPIHIPAKTLNLSESGALICAEQEVIGTYLYLQFSDQPDLAMRCRIAHSSRNASGQFLIGLQFEEYVDSLIFLDL